MPSYRSRLPDTNSSKAGVDIINNSEGRIVAYYDAAISQWLYAGQNWVAICQEIISHLPPQVHISECVSLSENKNQTDMSRLVIATRE
jgi:hypothetical protein